MKKIIVAGSVFAFSAAVGATQLGTLSVTSMLNEPMKATLEVKDVPADISNVKVGLASKAVYRSLGKTYADELKDISVSVVSKSPYRIRLLSSRPVKTADFPVILVLDDNGRRAAKLYNLHFVDRSDAQKAAAKDSEALKTPARLDASLKEAEDAGRSAGAKTGQVRSDKVSVVPSAAQTAKPAPAPKKEVKAAVQKTQAASKPAQGKASSDPKDQGRQVADGTANIRLKGKRATVRVKEGTTLWSTLKPYVDRYPGAIMQQLIVQTIRSNPSCFEGGMSSGVMYDCPMVLPKRINVSREDALFYVNEHPDWDATKPAGDQSAAPAADAKVSRGGAAPSGASKAKPAADKPKAVEEKPAPAAVVTKAVSDEEAKPADSRKEADKSEDRPAEEKVLPKTDDQQPAKPADAAVPDSAAKPDVAAKPDAPGRSFFQKVLTLGGDSEGPISWILGSLLAVLAAIGVGYNMGRRRRSEPAAAAAGAAATVQFREPAPTTQDQLDGASRMLENRLQADAAAARGFPGEAPAAAAQTSEAEIQEQARAFAELMEAQPEKQAPEAVPAAPVQQAHQLEQNGLVRISQPSEPASQVSKSPFPNVPAGMAAVEPEEKQLAKIEKARAYMAVGAKAQAQELLEDVVKTSTGRVQQTASELMAMLEKK